MCGSIYGVRLHDHGNVLVLSLWQQFVVILHTQQK